MSQSLVAWQASVVMPSMIVPTSRVSPMMAQKQSSCFLLGALPPCASTIAPKSPCTMRVKIPAVKTILLFSLNSKKPRRFPRLGFLLFTYCLRYGSGKLVCTCFQVALSVRVVIKEEQLVKSEFVSIFHRIALLPLRCVFSRILFWRWYKHCGCAHIPSIMKALSFHIPLQCRGSRLEGL